MNENPPKKMISLRREFPFIGSVMLFCLFFNTFLAEIFNQGAYLLKMIPLGLLLFFFRKKKPDLVGTRFIVLYLLLVLYGYMLAFTAEDFQYSVSYATKYYLRII